MTQFHDKTKVRYFVSTIFQLIIANLFWVFKLQYFTIDYQWQSSILSSEQIPTHQLYMTLSLSPSLVIGGAELLPWINEVISSTVYAKYMEIIWQILPLIFKYTCCLSNGNGGWWKRLAVMRWQMICFFEKQLICYQSSPIFGYF